MLLDAGPQFHNNFGVVLLTHTHGDHIMNLPASMIGKGPRPDDPERKDNPKVQIYCPARSVKYVSDYICSLFSVNALADESGIIVNNFDMIPLPNERTKNRLMCNGKLIELETVGADHTVDTVVYGISVVKKKNKARVSGTRKKGW